MQEKMKSMKDNDIQDLIKLLRYVKLIGSKQIFKFKQDLKRFKRYKARLVIKGFTQKGEHKL